MLILENVKNNINIVLSVFLVSVKSPNSFFLNVFNFWVWMQSISNFDFNFQCFVCIKRFLVPKLISGRTEIEKNWQKLIQPSCLIDSREDRFILKLNNLDVVQFQIRVVTINFLLMSNIYLSLFLCFLIRILLLCRIETRRKREKVEVLSQTLISTLIKCLISPLIIVQTEHWQKMSIFLFPLDPYEPFCVFSLSEPL